MCVYITKFKHAVLQEESLSFQSFCRLSSRFHQWFLFRSHALSMRNFKKLRVDIKTALHKLVIHPLTAPRPLSNAFVPSSGTLLAKELLCQYRSIKRLVDLNSLAYRDFVLLVRLQQLQRQPWWMRRCRDGALPNETRRTQRMKLACAHLDNCKNKGKTMCEGME